ncbi:dihydrodipicolinate synthase family protein [Brucella gallinifaecis]|uniref:Dihydrodipicolinate synthase family protein n=1 Tax=Brucella gallinifaecis TaxID=215590 RepID=A0A502BRA1_9HYPH|nr:dihydrodipicolinate synthase family protein [Brucella gallinifaecis]TPF77112.1 dihydrodipicolinate synthase family protein [Brucella gallinifaecis]
MIKRIEGIIPVMITPFGADGKIDFAAVERLVDWYIDNGSDALFAVCQSSEMQFLSLEERVALATCVVKAAGGRIPVIASGHVSDTLEEQAAELNAIAQTGVDGLVLVTNRLDVKQKGGSTFIDDLKWLLEQLPQNMPLGLYECPAPFRRLLSDDELTFCANSGRFNILKDVSCDLETVARRVELTKGTSLAIVNANAAIAHAAMKAGSRGFTGVFTNIHPDLYKWLLIDGEKHPQLASELAVFLALAAMAEPMGYPKLAKLYHQRLGTFENISSRTITFDIVERFWALEALIEHIETGSAHFRERIASLK